MSAVLDQVSMTGSRPLPRGWRSVTLEDIVSDDGVFVDGDWVESKDQDPAGDVRLIQLADVGDGEYRDRSERFLTSEKASELGCTLLEPGDLLVARMPDPLGRACIFPGDQKHSVTVVDVAIVRPRNPEMNTRWLMYCINSPQFRRVVASLQSGSTRQRISRKNLAKIVFPLPPLEWQGLVVDEIEKQFSRLDEAVANLKRAKDRLDGYKGSIISEAVGGRATADVGTAPNGWRRDRLGDAAAKITSGSRDWSPYYGRGAAIFLLAQNVRPMSPDFSVMQHVDPPEADPARARSRVQRGDLLVTIVGANTGQACMVGELPGETFVCQSVALVRPMHTANAPYLNLWLNSPEHGRRYFDRCMYGQGRPHLSFDQLASMPIAIPPPHEQARIVAEVDRRLSIVREVEAEVDANLKRAQALRQAVLARAFAA